MPPPPYSKPRSMNMNCDNPASHQHSKVTVCVCVCARKGQAPHSSPHSPSVWSPTPAASGYWKVSQCQGLSHWASHCIESVTGCCVAQQCRLAWRRTLVSSLPGGVCGTGRQAGRAAGGWLWCYSVSLMRQLVNFSQNNSLSLIN